MSSCDVCASHNLQCSVEFVQVVYLRIFFGIFGCLVVLLFTRNCGLNITLFKEPVDFFYGHIIEIPMITDIISVAGMVFIRRV